MTAPMNFTRNFRLLSSFLLAAGVLTAVLAGGCSKAKVIEIDDHFSYNVARVPAGYFESPKLQWTPAQKDVLSRRGAPDFVRFWWRPDGSIIRSSDLMSRGNEKMKEQMTGVKQSWIYMQDGEEVLFVGPGHRTQPLSEVMKLICAYGDPSERKPPVMRGGHMYETWQWIDQGIQIEFVDGQEGSRTHFKGTGSGTYLLK